MPHRCNLFFLETALLLVEGPFMRFLPDAFMLAYSVSLWWRHDAMLACRAPPLDGAVPVNQQLVGAKLRVDGWPPRLYLRPFWVGRLLNGC